MTMTINASSEAKLKRVHPDLVKVVRRSAALIKEKDFGFIITCGPRSIEEQRILVAKGASKTMNSRHIPGRDGTSKAVDYAATIAGKVRWDWPLYSKLAVIVKQAAKDVGVPIEWGGDWARFRDGPHFQLPHSKYP